MARIVFACFLVALFEGLDIQSMGVAAPHVAPALGLDPQAIGLALSASTFGLMIGSGLGGWLSDRMGRRAILILSMAVFGMFSLLTIAANSMATLIAVRVLTGIGLGGALPSLITIATQIAPEKARVTLLGIIYCGLPCGGAVAEGIAGFSGDLGWRLVFVVGGVGPLLLIPLLLLWLPEYHAPEQARRGAGNGGSAAALFGAQTVWTVQLWIAYFFTLLAVYLLLNWLPLLMVGKGLDKAQAAQSAIYLNAGAVMGSIALGRLSDRANGVGVCLVTYAGMIASVVLLGQVDAGLAMAAAFVAGFFVIGGQLVLYALAPVLYPEAHRGAGVGAAVAAGRAGSVTGPLLGGIVLSQGLDPGLLPLTLTPGLLIALLSALLLIRYFTVSTTANPSKRG